eukprot:UN15790
MTCPKTPSCSCLSLSCLPEKVSRFSAVCGALFSGRYCYLVT